MEALRRMGWGLLGTDAEGRKEEEEDALNLALALSLSEEEQRTSTHAPAARRECRARPCVECGADDHLTHVHARVRVLLAWMPTEQEEEEAYSSLLYEHADPCTHTLSSASESQRPPLTPGAQRRGEPVP